MKGCRAWRESCSGTPPPRSSSAETPRKILPLATVADLLAIGREALANVARHARADHAWIEISVGDGRIGLEIGDDGEGIRSDRPLERGHNGWPTCESEPRSWAEPSRSSNAEGGGTRIIVTVPLPVRGEPA